MYGNAGAQLFNLHTLRRCENPQDLPSRDQKSIQRFKILGFLRLGKNLFNKDAGTSAAIGVITRDHSDPSPTKMLDKLH